MTAWRRAAGPAEARSSGSGLNASTRKRVLLAAPRGFCAGVERAVQTVEAALRQFGGPVYVLREIVHNAHVVTGLAAKGAVFVTSLAQVPPGARVVFSAHGVAPSTYAEADARTLRPIDAICPLVTKVHQEARRYARAGYEILLVGHAEHEEVVGTLGEAPDRIRIVENIEQAQNVVVADPSHLVWLSQTTLAVDEVVSIVEHLRRRFPRLEDPPSDDICYASQNRQNAVKAIAAECDLVLVVGSVNSSNSVRLVEVARQAGARDAHLVEDVAGVDEAWFAGVACVAVTAGASAPEHLVTELLARLVVAGFTDVTHATVAVESIQFGLPSGVR